MQIESVRSNTVLHSGPKSRPHSIILSTRHDSRYRTLQSLIIFDSVFCSRIWIGCAERLQSYHVMDTEHIIRRDVMPKSGSCRRDTFLAALSSSTRHFLLHDTFSMHCTFFFMTPSFSRRILLLRDTFFSTAHSTSSRHFPHHERHFLHATLSWSTRHFLLLPNTSLQESYLTTKLRILQLKCSAEMIGQFSLLFKSPLHEWKLIKNEFYGWVIRWTLPGISIEFAKPFFLLGCSPKR